MAVRRRLVLATGNAGKQRELAALLGPLGYELLRQTELGVESVEETGTTFEANALLKARHASAATGLPALADDSGSRSMRSAAARGSGPPAMRDRRRATRTT
jgi:non-canonical purine NTP pyrophosphatase (RdgB/HAM1 family)